MEQFSPPYRLMEDHRDAYFFWKELGLQGTTCVHVDAHLDVSNFKVPQYDLDFPEINCANFLYRACREGLVAHLVWVIPPHLPSGRDLLDWTLAELQRWMSLTIDEFVSLHLERGRVEGRLAGASLTICRSDQMPPLGEGPILLDIDIDYFLDPQDGLWQDPFELHRHLLEGDSPVTPRALTVAYSVKGGYTPLPKRYLGDLTALVFGGQIAEARRLWDLFQTPAILEDAVAAPNWLRAAALVDRAFQAGQDHEGPAWEAAAALDPGYRVQPVDVASMYQIRKKLDLCLSWLNRLSGGGSGQDGVEVAALYLGGFAAFREGQMELALEKWRLLLAHPACPQEAVTLGHVLELCGRAQQRAGLHAQALESFRPALKLDSRNAELWRLLARSLAQLGQQEEAARTYRKALNLAPHDLASLEARLELAQVYQALGQTALAQAECRRIITGNAPAGYKQRAELQAWRVGRAAAR